MDAAPLIAFQGEPGANSDIACRTVFPEMTPLPCATFEDAFAALARGEAERAMIPIKTRTRSPAASPTSTTSCRTRGWPSSASTSCRSTSS